MLRYFLFLTVTVLLSCEQDPLTVRNVDIDERTESSGLTEFDPTVETGWTASDGIRTATAPASLELLPQDEALTLSFNFRMSENAEAKLLLGGQHALALPSLTLDTTAFMRSAVDIRPDVWQNLEIAYLPATATTPALLVATYLNGNLVYYQQPLPDVESGGPLTLELTEGEMSVTNLQQSGEAGKASSLASNGEVNLNLPLIHYAYYAVDGRPKTFDGWATQEPAKEGYISRFDLGAIREANRDYAIRFEGNLQIPKAGPYTFHLRSSTHSALFIDGEPVVALGPDTEGIENDGTVTLSEGTHEVRLDHYQETNWNHLLLKYSYGEQERKSFNDMPEGQAVATPRSQETTPVETDDRPYLLRSFLNFPMARVYDYTQKRTHVVNVGEADGPHYSYDLQNGALLQVWRGPFVDVSEMWEDRGEPQVVRALGPAVSFDGRPQWATDANEWPVEADGLRHRRYELDAEGRPTFIFSHGEAGEVSDHLVPNAQGLERTLTNQTGGETLLTTIASAASIRETAPGVFETLNPGLNIQVLELASGGLRLLKGEGTQRLVAELPPGEHLTYAIDW
ncbi:PA14 domain-containing protein [Neolewinella xylanilytica]|uniref:PA14 domain-containing protein n=1 Tax=Neolewinella xylanilytica TaxID=1514080 RepID=A0A2S6I625_9BACT|nr:PA14 domain-containing protein [Neolewinella xylanilytica]PPK86623.1 PA14 domain-containing protein [Neolewinella xylanilytica]